MVLQETRGQPLLPTNAGHRQRVRTLKITCHTASRLHLQRLTEGMDALLPGVLHTVRDGLTPIRFTLRQRSRELSCLHHDHWLMEAELELSESVR